MKKTVLIAILISIFNFQFSTSHAQHFDWAKGFGTSNANNGACHITGSVTDSVGNLYILGQFRNDSEWGTGWDAERLLPMTPYGPNVDNINTIIAKISSDGEMVWKKVIHSNNGTGQFPIDIKKLGDTAFACLVQLQLPTEDHYTYYLDTLIRERSNYPINSLYFEDPIRTAFVMFDFDGNIIEQHFLNITYIDTLGNDIVKYYNYDIDPTPWYCNLFLQSPSFAIDDDGNIYVCRRSMDMLTDSINAQNGLVHGIKIWVDERQVGVYINENKPKLWYPQIMKFSPHFDTLLACRYMVQKNNDGIDYNPIGNTCTYIDRNSNVYILYTLNKNGYHSDTITIDSISGLSFSVTDRSQITAFLVKTNSELKPQWVIALEDSVINMSNAPSMTWFHDVCVDNDSNMLFL